jgi:hypothetical protein
MARARALLPSRGSVTAVMLLSLLVLTAAQDNGNTAEPVGAAPASAPAAAVASDASPAAPSSPPSPACQAKLEQLQFSGNLPVVMIQLSNLNQVAATAAELQLLAKGPHLPGLMTTCGGPGGLN